MRHHRLRRRRGSLVAAVAGIGLSVGLAAALTGSPAQAAVTKKPAPSPTTGSYTTLNPNPCGTMSTSDGQDHAITHVIWVVFENMTAPKVLGSPGSDPYLGSLAQSCGLATNYQSTPFAGAKFAMTSGTNWGITGDASPEPGPDLYAQLGSDWHQYMGGMTTPCQATRTTTYFPTHNPATYFADDAESCPTQDLPLPSDPTQMDLSSAFTWIEADVPESMHGCPQLCAKTAPGRLAAGDAWAAQVLPAVFASPQYQDGSTVVFVVWDQGGKNQSNTALIAVSPFITPGTTSDVAYTHYSLLRGTEEYLSLPLLGEAADTADTASVAGDFGLPLPSLSG